MCPRACRLFHWWPWGLVMQNSCELWGRCDNSKKPITNTKNEKNIFIIQNVLFGSGSALIFKIWKINVRNQPRSEQLTAGAEYPENNWLEWNPSFRPAGGTVGRNSLLFMRSSILLSHLSIFFFFWNVFKKWLCVPLQPIKWPNDVPWMLMKHWRRHNKVSG